jgi:hypothetical protein
MIAVDGRRQSAAPGSALACIRLLGSGEEGYAARLW